MSLPANFANVLGSLNQRARRLERIGVSGEEETHELTMSQGVHISKCSNSSFTLNKKCSQVSVMDSDNVKVALEATVSGAEVFRCNDLDLTVSGSVPTLTIESTTNLNVTVTEDCDFFVTGNTNMTVKAGETEQSIPDYPDSSAQYKFSYRRETGFSEPVLVEREGVGFVKN